MLQNEGLSPLKCLTFFIIPIVKFNTSLFLDITLYNTRWQNCDHFELPLNLLMAPMMVLGWD